MEIHQLRYILALAQERNFGRAAKRIHITQPTLSQQIKKLEKELGASLFERSSHGVRLTEAGEKFLPHAIAIMDRIEKSVHDVQEQTGEIRGRLRVATIPTIGPYLLPLVLGRIKKLAPKLTLELYEETTSVLLEHLKEGRLDLGVLSLPVSDPGIVSRSLGSEDFFLAVSKNHPLAAKKKVTLRDLKKEKLLILQEGHCFSDQSLDYCKRSREDAQVIFQGSSLASVMKLAQTGEGITLVPKIAVETQIYPKLRFLPFSSPKPKRELGIVWRISTPLRDAHRLWVKVVEDALKSLLFKS